VSNNTKSRKHPKATSLLVRQGLFDEASEWLANFRPNSNLERMEVLIRSNNILRYRGIYSIAVERSLAILNSNDTTRGAKANACVLLAFVYADQGDLRRATDFNYRVLDYKSGPLFRAAFNQESAWILYFMGKHQSAMNRCNEAINFNEDRISSGNEAEATRAQVSLERNLRAKSTFSLAIGDIDGAREAFSRTDTEPPTKVEMIFATTIAAEIDFFSGDPFSALNRVEQALASIEISNFRSTEARARRVKAEALYAIGDLNRSGFEASRAYQVARSLGQKFEMGRILLLLSDLAGTVGKSDLADQRCRHAESLLHEIGSTWILSYHKNMIGSASNRHAI